MSYRIQHKLPRTLAFAAGFCVFQSLLQAQALQTSLSKVAEDAGADESRYIFEVDHPVSMRDGVRLSTTVVRPRSSQPVATVLVRTPYDFSVELEANDSFFRRLFANQYAVVLQNERGTGWSGGRYQFLAGARNDGYDTLTWISAQPWSNGRVGTFGCSSSAENQLALGTMRHPALRAQIVMSGGDGIGRIAGEAVQGLFYRGGVPAIGSWAPWYALYGHQLRPTLPANISADERSRIVAAYSPGVMRVTKEAVEAVVDKALWTLPSSQVLRSAGFPTSDFDRFITLTPTDPHWRNFDFITSDDKNSTPTLNVSAWGDESPYEILKLYELQARHPDEYLIMAPTAHCKMMSATEHTMVGERDVGDARLPYEDIYLAWFDQHLKGVENAFQGQPKVRVFLLGANAWLSGEEWPFKGVATKRYFLGSDGHANSVFGSGFLSEVPPRNRQSFDDVISDPSNPVPSRGTSCCDLSVFRDQASIEARQDVLVYTTPVLAEGRAVLGDVTAILYVSTSTKDADLAIKLVDVDAKGRALNLQDSILRLRYRQGFAAPAPMVPGYIYRVEISGIAAADYLPPGSRLRIELAGSNFPNYERNLNTGGHNYDETAGLVSTIRVYHDAQHPSYINVPVDPSFGNGHP